MADVSEVSVPNWLNELEAKRERRLKARLGHEAGAGAPCLTCSDKCPGLDLHFWRKICKNCKCPKESHDVHDDDLYGWAQFQLLGSKPNKTKRKIVLPGKKEEVELDWAPKGPLDTIDRYLKTLPPDSLPVKGSKAAQDRKQLLQKQIPIHDLDPTLCHDLTESELQKMHDYIEHMKTFSVGVGEVIQLNSNPQKSTGLHHIDHINATYRANRYPKSVGYTENINAAKEQLSAPLAHALNEMSLGGHLGSGAGAANLRHGSQETARIGPGREPNENMESVRLGGIKDLCYPTYENRELNDFFENVPNPVDPNNANLGRGDMANSRSLPHYAPGSFNIVTDHQHPITSLRDLAHSTYDPNNFMGGGGDGGDAINSNYPVQQTRGLQPLHAAHHIRGSIEIDNLNPANINIGPIRDINYDLYGLQDGNTKDDQLPLTENQKPPPSSLESVNESTDNNNKKCHKCNQQFANDEFAIYVERSNVLYHSNCFKCSGCNQNLADMVYFYDKETDSIYCGRDFAKIRGIPRCDACDELIFVKEYCLAENCTFHVKHFCCFECDEALAGQNYVVEETQPLCLPCYEKLKANQCQTCHLIIKPDEQGISLKDLHFHCTDDCFTCRLCKKPLLGAKLLLKNQRLYCSVDCYGNDQ